MVTGYRSETAALCNIVVCWADVPEGAVPPSVIKAWRRGRGLGEWGSEIWGWKETCREPTGAGVFEEGHAQRSEAFPTPSDGCLHCPLNVSTPHGDQGVNKELAHFWGTFFSRQILRGPVNQDGFIKPISSHQSSWIMHFLWWLSPQVVGRNIKVWQADTSPNNQGTSWDSKTTFGWKPFSI